MKIGRSGVKSDQTRALSQVERGAAREAARRSADIAATPKKKKINWASLPEIWSLIQPRKGVLFLGLILVAINRVSGLVLPGSSKYLFDNVIAKKQVNLLLPIVGVVVAGRPATGGQG